MRVLMTIAISLVTAAPAAAQGIHEFPYTYRSAHFLGRGDTGIADADNEDAIFYNPAGLAKGKGIYKKTVFAAPMIEFSLDTRDLIRQLTVEGESPLSTLVEHSGKPQHAGFNMFTGIILRRAALGVFANNSTSLMLYKSPDAGSMEAVAATTTANTGATFSLAEDFWNQSLMVGLTGKYILKAQAAFQADAASAESLDSVDPEELAMQGTGFGADLGLMYHFKNRAGLSLGLTFQDIGNTLFTPSAPTEVPKSERALKDNQQTINFGLVLEPSSRMSRFKLLLDYRDIEDRTGASPYKKTHVGGEINVRELVGLTAGLNQGYPTYGLYLDLRFLRLDVGFYSEELGEKVGQRPDGRYFFRIMAAL